LVKSLEDEANEIKAISEKLRPKGYRKSRLDKYKKQLLDLHEKHELTPKELQMWLRGKRIKVAHTTVTRWLKKNEVS